MNTTARSARWRRQALAAIALVAVVAGLVGPAAAPAQAGQGTGNPVLQVSTSTASAGRVTDITVTGRDYLVPPYAPGTAVFGGVYVFFGWVSDPAGFGPAIRNSSNNDGTYGVTYAYPGDGGDPGTRDPGTGTMRLVAFTPNGESGEATDFHMDRDGNWTTQMRIYGSQFTYVYPPTGEQRTVDCQAVQCGVFTIGAHGKPSATNERFVPIRFTGDAAPVTIPPATPSSVTPKVPATTAPPAGGPGTPAGDAGAPAPTDPATPPPGDGSGAPSPSAPSADDPDPDEPVALGVSEVRSTGSSTGPLVAVVAVVVLVAAIALGRGARRRKRSAPTTGGT